MDDGLLAARERDMLRLIDRLTAAGWHKVSGSQGRYARFEPIVDGGSRRSVIVPLNPAQPDFAELMAEAKAAVIVQPANQPATQECSHERHEMSRQFRTLVGLALITLGGTAIMLSDLFIRGHNNIKGTDPGSWDLYGTLLSLAGAVMIAHAFLAKGFFDRKGRK